MKFTKALSVAALTLGLAATPAFAREVKFASFQPPKSPAVAEGLIPFTKRVEVDSKGALSFQVFSGGALLGARDTTEGLGSGIAQMGQVVFGYHPAEFPSSVLIANMAMYGKYSPAIAAAVTEYVLLDCPSCRKEYAAQGITVLGLTSTSPYVMIGKKDLSDIKDLKGLKVRTPGALWDRWARDFGATPVNMPSSDMYEALSRGALDVILQPLGSIKSHSFWDIAHDVTLTNLGTYRSWGVFVAGKPFWDGLSAADKRLLLNESARGVLQVALGYMALDETALKEAPQHGVKIHEPDAATEEVMAAFIAKDKANIIANAQGKLGLKDATQRVEILKTLIAKWEKAFAPIHGNLNAMSALLQQDVISKVDLNTLN